MKADSGLAGLQELDRQPCRPGGHPLGSGVPTSRVSAWTAPSGGPGSGVPHLWGLAQTVPSGGSGLGFPTSGVSAHIAPSSGPGSGVPHPWGLGTDSPQRWSWSGAPSCKQLWLLSWGLLLEGGWGPSITGGSWGDLCALGH